MTSFAHANRLLSDSRIREMAEKIYGWMRDSAQKKAVLVDLGGIPVNLEVKKPLTMAEAMGLHMKRTQAEVAAQAVSLIPVLTNQC